MWWTCPKTFGLAPGLAPVPGGVAVHHACHARAQNMGAKSAEMLRLIPETKVDLIERCSGHGGTFGVMKKTRPLAVKVGKPTAKAPSPRPRMRKLCSDCPLACKHLGQLLVAETAGPGPSRANRTPSKSSRAPTAFSEFGAQPCPPPFAASRRTTSSPTPIRKGAQGAPRGPAAGQAPAPRPRGPLTFIFECFDTMLFQVQEMLLTRKAAPARGSRRTERL